MTIRKRYNTKPHSKRKTWAIKRNWMIKRVRGASSVFSLANRDFMKDLLDGEDDGLITRIATGLLMLDEKISKSKWKE
jgi:hypothetical protein